MATKNETSYFAYMLRLWQVHDKGSLVWRASLERAHAEERIGFSSVDELCLYLYERIREASSFRHAVEGLSDTKTDSLQENAK